jgi:DNA-binding transcriptional ArsR family regulator
MADETGQGDQNLLVALRHPLRRSILKTMLDDGDPISPRQLAEKMEEPLSNTSYHVRVLAGCGAVNLVDQAPVRGSMQHFYSVEIEEPWALRVLGVPEEDEENGDG